MQEPNMHSHLLTPLAPVVLRTGKPFGETGGSDTYPFPLPSTIAGAVRSARADAINLDFRDDSERAKLLKWAIQGPLPCSIDSRGAVEPLFPRPLDSRYLLRSGTVAIQTLVPRALGESEGCDLHEGLLPVFTPDDDQPSKPVSGPAWWSADAMEQWLLGRVPEAPGPQSPPIENRTHVALDPNTLAANAGQLYQSAGPDFEAPRVPGVAGISERGWGDRRYGFLVRCSERIEPTLARLGGEARLTAVAPGAPWPTPPAALKKALAQAERIRLVLATPALLLRGWRPGWIEEDGTGTPPTLPELRLRLKAAVIDRWLPISGWDLAKKCPKAIRRLAPAGTVYWFDVIEAPAGWVDALWLASVSDNEQDRRDGFGLVLPGLWK